MKKNKNLEDGYIDILNNFRPLGNLEDEKLLADKLMKSDDFYERLEGVDLYMDIHAKLNENKIGGEMTKGNLNCQYCKKKYVYVKNFMKHLDNKHK